MFIANHINIKPGISSNTSEDFERAYLVARKKEQRMYTDEQVAVLPNIDRNHIHSREWRTRKRSATRLFNYLNNNRQPLSVLDIGCGNGWLSAKLSGTRRSTIMGIDIINEELLQARRVFGKKSNLQFSRETLNDLDPGKQKFDVIIFAASIQYFASFEQTISTAIELLNPRGAVHLLDSHFYPSDRVDEARDRSNAYYAASGNTGMSGYYFHHSTSDLKKFRHKVLFDPGSVLNKLFYKDPFPWIAITA